MQEEEIKKVKDGRKKDYKQDRRTERKKEFRGKEGKKKKKSLLLALNGSG